VSACITLRESESFALFGELIDFSPFVHNSFTFDSYYFKIFVPSSGIHQVFEEEE